MVRIEGHGGECTVRRTHYPPRPRPALAISGHRNGGVPSWLSRDKKRGRRKKYDSGSEQEAAIGVGAKVDRRRRQVLDVPDFSSDPELDFFLRPQYDYASSPAHDDGAACAGCERDRAAAGATAAKDRVLHRLARAGRARRLLPGSRRRHVPQVRARRRHPHGRPAGERTSMASRVAGSQLCAIGLPQLATTDFADYEALALSFARDAERMRACKAELAA